MNFLSIGIIPDVESRTETAVQSSGPWLWWVTTIINNGWTSQQGTCSFMACSPSGYWPKAIGLGLQIFDHQIGSFVTRIVILWSLGHPICEQCLSNTLPWCSGRFPSSKIQVVACDLPLGGLSGLAYDWSLHDGWSQSIPQRDVCWRVCILAGPLEARLIHGKKNSSLNHRCSICHSLVGYQLVVDKHLEVA